MSTVLNRVASLLEDIEAAGDEKRAAARVKRANSDPGGYDGSSSHPTAKLEGQSGESSQTEGFMSADNSKTLKEQTPNTPDSKPELTPGSAPKSDDVQLGQGIDIAKPTGEDSKNEDDYTDRPKDSESGGKGGTDHIANGSLGEKYSSWTEQSLLRASDDELYKLAVELGNDIAADVANGFFDDKPKAKTAAARSYASSQTKAAANGYAAAAAAGSSVEDTAAQHVQHIMKLAAHQADLVADHLTREALRLKKQAEDEEAAEEAAADAGADPTGGASGSEDHAEMPPGGGGGGGEELLAAMAGGGAPAGDPMAAPGANPAAAMGGGGGGGDPSADFNAMPNDDALQQLAMALMELGIDPAQLASAGGGGPKMASAVVNFKRSGKFRFEQTKTAKERNVRNWIKGHITELCKDK